MTTLLIEVAVRATLVATGTACILWALRIRTADVKHAAWTMVVVAMLLLPIWSVAGPKLHLAVLPPIAASLDSGSVTNADLTQAAPQPTVTPAGPTPVPKDPATADTSARVMLVLAGAYLLGALALLVRLGVGTVQARRLRRGAAMHADRATSARCVTPITVGWLSPVLILPEGWEAWSAERLDAVVTHEQEHARRHDPLVQWVALLNRAIFWFHPLAWWVERRLATLAEEACDAAVIRAGHSPQDYSDYLIDMARALTRRGRRLNVVGMAMPGSGLPERMRHIFEELPMRPLSRTRMICTLTFCTMSSMVFAAGMLAPRPTTAANSLATAGAHVGTGDVLLEPGPTLSPEPVVQTPPNSGAQPAISLEQPRSESRVPARIETPAADQPDFSGHWSLVSSTFIGRGRGEGAGEAGSGGERKTSSIWFSGAPVNCGPECALVQNAKTLTIRRSTSPEGTWVPDDGEVVLNLDGSDSTVNHPSAKPYVVHADWEGDKLVVTYQTPWHFTVTQVLSVVDGHLTVVTNFGVDRSSTTMKYAKP